jgi:hypothetical protein
MIPSHRCAQTAGVRRMEKPRIAMVIATVLFLLLAGGTVWPARAGSARQLAGSIDAALAGVAQAAGEAQSGLGPGKPPGNPRSAPFWSALEAMRLRVSRIEGSLDRRDGDFFGLVDQGSTDLGELRVAWARSGARNEKVAEGLRISSASYRMLRSTYGREGVRQRQGGPLSDAERRQLQRLQQAERRLAASLRLLRDQARRRNEAAIAAELERFRAEAERIAWAPLDLGSYLNASIAASELRGEWSADATYLRKAAPPQAWAAADETVQDLYVDSDIGQVFTVDLGKTPDAPEATDAPDTETGSAAGPVVEEIAVETPSTQPADGVAGLRDERDKKDAGEMDDMDDVDVDESAPAAEAGDAAPAVPVGAPAQPVKPAAPPVAVPPIPPPIG